MTPAASRDGPAVADLRRASLAEVRSIDFRAPERDLFADEAAVWDRFAVSWAGLDDAAWALPGAAPSDAGGPDWSLLDHVAHVGDWQELAVDYLGRVLDGGAWPADDDYDGGDFDRFNERRRARWADLTPTQVRGRLADARVRTVALVRRLPADTIRTDEAWGWVYMVLHGHELDHLGIVEPWAARLRARQVEGDPFTADPRPAGDGSPAAIDRFWSSEASVFALFDELVRPIPVERWEELGPTADWTLKDHVAHLARWFEAGTDAIETHARSGTWPTGPAEGVDAWNAREQTALRNLSPEDALARFDAGQARLRAVVRSMTPADLASPDGTGWAWECLHGHVRQHLAMVGPWAARLGWPATR